MESRKRYFFIQGWSTWKYSYKKNNFDMFDPQGFLSEVKIFAEHIMQRLLFWKDLDWDSTSDQSEINSNQNFQIFVRLIYLDVSYLIVFLNANYMVIAMLVWPVITLYLIYFRSIAPDLLCICYGEVYSFTSEDRSSATPRVVCDSVAFRSISFAKVFLRKVCSFRWHICWSDSQVAPSWTAYFHIIEKYLLQI